MNESATRADRAARRAFHLNYIPAEQTEFQQRTRHGGSFAVKPRA